MVDCLLIQVKKMNRIRLSINTAPLYGINKEEAKDIVSFIKSTVNKNLEHIAKQCGISRDSIEYMRPAFQL